jgi:GNAT superfamily N-acetyltransferase
MVNIRKATEQDLDTIIRFQKKMARETENIVLDEEILSNGVRSVFLDETKGFYLVAEKDNEIIACMMLTPEWSDWRNGFFLWIQSLYVLPQQRNQGIFRKMYEFIRDVVLTSENYKGLRLYVVNDNQLAQEVYIRIGMDGNHYRMFEWVKNQ